MHRITHAFAVALLLAVSGVSHGQPDRVPAVQQQAAGAPPAHAGAQRPPPLRPGRSLSREDRGFLVAAAQSGHAQAQAGQLARTRSANPRVREFGRRLVSDHELTSAQLQQVARAHGTALPTAPSAPQRRSLGLLASLSGPAFDQRFLQEMVRHQREGIERFTAVLRDESRDRALQGYARQRLPMLRGHLEAARRLHLASREEAARQSWTRREQG